MAKSAAKNIKAVNTAEFGRKYYDVLDVYSQKIMSQIVEKSRDLNIDKTLIKELNKILTEETARAKSWGFDQLIKVVKD
jgi:hypothetical protein